jgi:hypothetical protein
VSIKTAAKIVSLSLGFLVLLFLFSPLVSLLIPKLADHTYSTISFQLIADKETQGALTPEEKALCLFKYVRRNVMLPPGSRPYEGRPLDYLINGVGWCDYMSRVFNSLLAKEGIPSRYAMLLDEKGELSTHTLNEVFIRGKWAALDPLTGVIFRDRTGQYLSLEELSAHPEWIATNYRLVAMKRLTGNSNDYYNSKFPMHYPPRRSDIRLEDLSIYDHLTRLYVRLFKEGFSDFYQDVYLGRKAKDLAADYRLFYLAHNYHLHYRRALAKSCYNVLIEQYPASTYRQDAIFFLGLLYIKQNENYKMGIEVLEYLLGQYPDTKWLAYVNFYLGKAYDNLGNTKQADFYYSRAAQNELDMEIINRLINDGVEIKI